MAEQAQSTEEDVTDAKMWNPFKTKTSATDSVPVIIKPAKVNTFNYKMDYAETGLCLIIDTKISHCRYERNLREESTDKDLEALKFTFETLGFTVQIETTDTDYIEPCLKKAANEDHSKRSCFVCVVLVDEKDATFNLGGSKELTYHFTGDKCRGLVGKPKMFFVLGTEISTSYAMSLVRKVPAKIPVQADFLKVSFISSGKLSSKNEDAGSWYIQTLCRMLLESGDKLNLLTLLTRVNHLTAQEFKSQGMKERPCIVSMLTKEVVFPGKI
ncbi:caspase-3-like isoform X2 [Ascaphus truei]|uniref:caspase-3-like isoform X2 n=1 Tax=Ascaphus truei TaxID=8439 RepID=UPI003F593102